MLAFCTKCWSEMYAKDTACPHCGAKVDDDPRSFEQKLIAALNHPLPETRSRICWLLGQKKATWATTHLLRMLRDTDLFVRVAALRALGEIGDVSAAPALKEAARDERSLVRVAAEAALKQISVRTHDSSTKSGVPAD